MPRFCGIVGCGSTAERDKKSFFRLPVELSKGSNNKKNDGWTSLKELTLPRQGKNIYEEHFISDKLILTFLLLTY